MDPSPIIQRVQEAMQNGRGGVLIVAIIPPANPSPPQPYENPPQSQVMYAEIPQENACSQAPVNQSQESLDEFLMRMLQEDP